MTLIWRGEQALAELEHAIHEAVRAGGEALHDAADEIIPTETHELRESGKVTADGPTAAVSYNTPYAQQQHESGYPHHTEPESRHFLSRPMLERGGEVLAAMHEALQEELGL